MKRIEAQNQRALVAWAEARSHTEPRLKWLLAVPNGGKRSAITARLLKLEGVKAGVADLFLPVAVGAFHGMWIEMKAPGGTVKQNQEQFHIDMKAAGYYCVVAWDWVEARRDICAYLGIEQ